MIEVTDRGFTLGDGLFETVRVGIFDGDPQDRLQPHFDRMSAGCRVLGLPEPHWDDHYHEILSVLETVTTPRAALRLTWSAGPGGRGLDRPAEPTARLIITIASAPLPGPARLVTAKTVRRNEMSPASRLKTLSYLDNVLAREEARAAGGDEAVMLNTKGHLACAAAANLFWVRDGRVFTPALACGVLAGITRGHLMARLPVEEVVVGQDALKEAEAVFLTNSLVGIRAVTSLDGKTLPSHPLVTALAGKLPV